MKVLVTILLGLVAALPASAQAPGIFGDYVEARSGEVFTCGCLFSGQMVTGGKEAILVWRITRGDYQGIPLANIKVAAVVVGERHLGLTETPRRSVLYLDGITSVAQREAILSLWSHQYASALGAIESTHPASITFEQEGEVLSVRIPGIAQINVRKARLPEDSHPGSILWYQPFTPLQQSSLITILDNEYTGLEFHRQWRDLMPSISGYMGKFTLSSNM
jgi:hypothetical protein